MPESYASVIKSNFDVPKPQLYNPKWPGCQWTMDEKKWSNNILLANLLCCFFLLKFNV